MESQGQNTLLWVTKWGSLVFAAIGCIYSIQIFEGPWKVAVLTGTGAGALVLTFGREVLVNFFDAVGIRDPIQSFFIFVLGFMYFIAGSFGMTVVVLAQRQSLGEFVTFIVWGFGILAFISRGAFAAFGNPES